VGWRIIALLSAGAFLAACTSAATDSNETTPPTTPSTTKAPAAPAPKIAATPTPAAHATTVPAPAPAGSIGGSGENGLSVDESAIPAPATGFATSRITTAQYSPFSSDGVGAFRVNCYLSHMNFDDPLVFPGQVRATHLHAFFGHTGIDAFSNNTSINTTGTSTCTGGTENRSAYWAPAMIDTATGRPVNQSAGSELDRVNALQVYYKTGYRGVASNTVRNFPAGLRIVAGDARASSSYGGSVNDSPATYHCHSRGQGSRQTSFPNCAPGDLLVMSIMYPQCWDGVNLDSADHKSHMAYGTWGPVSGQNGAGCPSTHPVPLPEITQNYRFRIPAGGMATWRLASDTYNGPAGYSGHADWWNGWNAATFQRVVDNCYRGGLDCQMNLLGNGQALN